jgi:hypothetical protein
MRRDARGVGSSGCIRLANWQQEETDGCNKTLHHTETTGDGHKTRASLFIEGIAKRRPGLFVHWHRGMVGAFA